jgi:PAS domain S-box-containing protein
MEMRTHSIYRRHVELVLWLGLVLHGLLCPAIVRAAPGSEPDPALQTVRLQIWGEPRFQYAGIYAAIEQGYFSDAGLNVELVTGLTGQSEGAAILSGEIEYGIGGSEILHSRLQGADLVILAVIMQKSPDVLIAVRDNGIEQLEDLRGQRLLLYDRVHSVEIYEMLRRGGLEKDSFTVATPWKHSLDTLEAGEFSATHGNIAREPQLLANKGHEVLLFEPTEYGIKFYGDSLFTTEWEIREQPQRASAMRHAILLGWQYALDHPHAMISLIQHEYESKISTSDLLHESQIIQELIAYEYNDLGQMSDERWRRMAGIMQEMGLVSSLDRLEGLTYEDYPAFDPQIRELRRYLLGIVLAALLALGLLMIYNFSLRRAVQYRTSELTDLNSRLSHQLEENRKVVVALQQSRMDYAEAQRIAKVGNWSYDCVSGHLEWSEEVFRIYGINPDVAPSMADALEITIDEDRSRLRGCLRDAIRDGQHGSVVRRIIRTDGGLGYVNTVFEPVVNEQGRTVRLHGTVQDVTEIRLEQEARRESERAYDALFANSIELIFMFSTEGELIDANTRMLELIGAARDSVIGMDPAKPHHCQIIDELWRVFGRQGLAGTGDRNIHMLRVLDSHGKERWIEGYGVPLENDDGIHAVLGVARDVTERRRVEQKAISVERKYQSLFDNSVEMIFVVDLAGSFLEANDNALHKFGYPRSELPVLTLHSIADDVVYQRLMHSVQNVMAGERRGELQEFRGMTRLGEQLWFESAGVRLEKDGKPWAVLIVARDITDRKSAEEERRNLEAQLRQTQKLEAIGTLAGGIAHDFNNLLFAIRGNADLALTLPDDIENTRECLTEVLAASARATELVQQILSFARKSEVEMRVIDLNGIFGEVLRLIRATIPTSIEIVSDLGIGPHLVYGDVTQMHQLMMNLCSNAGYAMREHGGRLRIRLRSFDKLESFPGFSMNPDNRHILLTVEDTGAGISQSVLERIFEPFFTTKEMGEGTGMGLSAVHGIVMAMQGAIDVDSEVGIGTCFRILLPEAQLSMMQQPEQRIDIPGGTERVLVVDDEEAIVRVMRSSLSNLGYNVTACTESVLALETFRSSPDLFDLVITDQAMPGLTGNQLAREINTIRADLPIIVCSGNNSGTATEEGRRHGVAMFLHKPIERRELAMAIRSLLD